MRRAAQGLLLATFLLYAGFADGVPAGGMPAYVAVGLAILIALACTALPEEKRAPEEPQLRRGRQKG